MYKTFLFSQIIYKFTTTIIIIIIIIIKCSEIEHFCPAKLLHSWRLW